MREEILDMIASIEAVIDYPDYDVEEETYGTMEQGAKKLLARMEKLLELLDEFFKETPLFLLGCNMDESAVMTAYNAANGG